MNAKFTLLFLTLFLLVFGFNCAVGSNKNNKAFQNDSIQAEGTILLDSDLIIHPIQNLVQQKISYCAPQSGSVFVVWVTENYPLEESVLWNDGTKLTDGLLYTPLENRGDTFYIQLKVPYGARLQYNFWITKGKNGHYQDFWDQQSSGKITVTGSSPVFKNAVYSTVEAKKVVRTIDLGWIILALLIVVFVLLRRIYKKFNGTKLKVSHVEKVLFTGISLLVFHALARAEIIGVNLFRILLHPGGILKIIKAGSGDFLFVSGLVILFLLPLLLVKGNRIKTMVYRIFIVLAVFSTLVAFINIAVVVYLGKPFTYQWLYYADFLESNDAKVALQENLSLFIGFNLSAYCISMLVFSGILFYLYRLLKLRKLVWKIGISLVLVVMAVLIIMSTKTKETWTKGQSENAIMVMSYSVLTANSGSSFFFSEIQSDTVVFNPAESTKYEKPLVISGGEKVKNVLFIILESAGAVYFDGYGGTYQLSPNLEKYAKQALRFEQVYAHAPATNRSLVSILGSMYPHISYQSLTQEVPTLQQPSISTVLKNNGYRTSFFSSANLNFQNCKQFLSYRNFDCVEDFSGIECKDEFRLERSDYIEGDGIDDMCLADRLISWIDEDTTQNFFSMIWTVQGHYPYFFGQEEEDFGVSNYNFNRYLNCLKYNDKMVGKVMLALEERGISDNTLVVVVGDHGEAFGQHKQYGHGTALYEENLKVPLYFINPVLFHGETKNDIAALKDIAVTTLSILGMEIPETWHGRDLISTVSSEAFFFAPWSDYLFGYRKNNMKYIFNETHNTVEIYDLNTDPNEKLNLFPAVKQEELDFARKRMAAWVQYQNQFVKQIGKGTD